MKFDVNPAKLCKLLSLCKNALPTRAMLPILNNFLFDVDGDVLTVTASDTENTVRARIDVGGDVACGRACIDSGIVVRLLSSFEDESVSFTHDEDAGTMRIKSRSGSYAVPCFESEVFPIPETVDNGISFSVECKMLSALLGGVSYAMGKDTLRPVMSGTLFDISGGRLTAVATDAHVLATGSVVLKEVVGPVQCVIPGNTVRLVSSFLSDGNVDVVIGEKNIRFVTSGAEITSRLVDGKYPNYKAVIPKDNPLKVVLDRSRLVESVKRMLLFSNDTGACISAFRFGVGTLNIHTENTERKSASSDIMECDFDGVFDIGLDARKILSVLGNMVSDKVEMSFSDPARAAVIVPVGENPFGMLSLCMPCMLN